MIKVIIFGALLASYIISVMFFRKQTRIWHEDKRFVDPGIEDVLIMFIPVINVIVGIILMEENYKIKLARRFFGLK